MLFRSIGNVLAAIYYIAYFLRGKSSLSIKIKHFTFNRKICSNVLTIGIPASLGSMLMSISQMIMNFTKNSCIFRIILPEKLQFF